ncbi:hypothetical protein AK812_SmicGene20053 [Symbiodinium microadriaticum]|uniref:SAM domain-containing protein n=1 Tax=Symbiodinium microadriaticum TaxID=2951 RepID=A0A1Q9DR15_SYMMI|nr:hypothetical protein AK812_SmicGene20053 [Symbiodinium microadriaticum]
MFESCQFREPSVTCKIIVTVLKLVCFSDHILLRGPREETRLFHFCRMATVAEWEVEDVAAWVERSLELPCAALFVQANIDGPRLVQLDEEMLLQLGLDDAAHITCLLVRASSNQPTPVNSVLSSALCRERASAIAPFVQGSGLLPYRIFDDICAAPANGMPPAHQGTRYRGYRRLMTATSTQADAPHGELGQSSIKPAQRAGRMGQATSAQHYGSEEGPSLRVQHSGRGSIGLTKESGRRFIVSDLQGVARQNEVLLTDPQVLSITREYGPGLRIRQLARKRLRWRNALVPKELLMVVSEHVANACSSTDDEQWSRQAPDAFRPDVDLRSGWVVAHSTLNFWVRICWIRAKVDTREHYLQSLI